MTAPWGPSNRGFKAEQTRLDWPRATGASVSVAPSHLHWRRRPLPRGSKPVLWLVLLLPLAWLLARALTDDLGANPAEAVIRSLGNWALRILCLALAVTPLRIALRWPALGSVRRPIGLFAAAYAAAHALAYIWLDQSWQWAAVWADVLKRPFITVGMLAMLLLLVLVATSPHAVARRLGGVRWRRIHRSVYAIALLVILHFWWMRQGKQNFAQVWLWGSVVAVLLLARWPTVARWLQGSMRSSAH